MSLLLDFTIELNSFDTSYYSCAFIKIPTQQSLRLMPEVRVKVIKTREQLYSHVDTWYFWLWKGGLKGCSSLGTGLALRATL